MKLISGGRSDFVVVCGDDPCERFAAREMIDFLKASTGAELPLVRDPAGAPFVSLGDTAQLRAQNFGEPWSKPRRDSFFVRERAGNLFLCGRRPRGTLYAAYDFLERNVGVRFLASDQTFVPARAEVCTEGRDRLEEPAFDLRSFYTVQTECDSLYAARLRQVALYGEEDPRFGGGLETDGRLEGHNILEYADERARKHEFRYEDGRIGVDLCFSDGIDEAGNPIPGGTAETVAENLIRRIASAPGQLWFSLCQNDVPEGCDCPTCRERREKQGGYSGILIRFVNAVAGRVEEWRRKHCPEREIRIVTFAYAYTEQPPLNEAGEPLVRPAENVWIWPATAEQNMIYACDEKGQNPAFTRLLEGWKRVTDRFCYWDYRINFAEYLFYFPGLRIFARDFAFLEKFGIDYLFCEAASGDKKDAAVWLNEIKAYVASKLMWNPAQDAAALTEEFCRLYYGEAADAVLEVIRLFEDNYERLKVETPSARVHLLLGYRTCESDYYPRELLTRSIEILEEAIRACREERLELRLRNVLATPRRMLLRNYEEYFPDDERGKQALYRDFVRDCERLGFVNLGGWEFTLENLKKIPDYNWWRLNGIPY